MTISPDAVLNGGAIVVLVSFVTAAFRYLLLRISALELVVQAKDKTIDELRAEIQRTAIEAGAARAAEVADQRREILQLRETVATLAARLGGPVPAGATEASK